MDRPCERFQSFMPSIQANSGFFHGRQMLSYSDLTSPKVLRQSLLFATVKLLPSIRHVTLLMCNNKVTIADFTL